LFKIIDCVNIKVNLGIYHLELIWYIPFNKELTSSMCYLKEYCYIRNKLPHYETFQQEFLTSSVTAIKAGSDDLSRTIIIRNNTKLFSFLVYTRNTIW